MIIEVARGHIDLEVNGRKVTVGGEGSHYGEPDFVVISKSIVHWADGSIITDNEREEIIRDLRESAKRRGLTIEVNKL
jgi:hypothetical protein